MAEGRAADVDRAGRAARRAFDEGPWPRTRVAERSRILRRLGDLILARKDALARLETLDTGKPIRETTALDIPRAACNFHFFADLATRLASGFFPMDRQHLDHELREPVGVAGLICPWNLPLLLETWKVAPCLAAGNTCVPKPAELTPLTALQLADLAREAGLPDGVPNVVPGFGPDGAGQALVEHPLVDLISFTGSTATARSGRSAGRRPA